MPTRSTFIGAALLAAGVFGLGFVSGRMSVEASTVSVAPETVGHVRPAAASEVPFAPLSLSAPPARPAPLDREQLLAWAARDPAAAGAWVRERPDDVERQQVLAAVLRRWLRLDPRAAADYALALPDAEARACALEQVATGWAAADPAALSAWAAELPSAPELDAVAAALATLPALVEHRPETAFEWADGIVDEQLRAQTIDHVLVSAEASLAARYSTR